MANIKSLQMWKTVCNDVRIDITKTLFGLRTVVTYKPTGSVLSGLSLEYTVAEGEHLKRVLETPSANLDAAIAGYRPLTTVNGNYLAEVCVSRDSAFLAVQLFRYQKLSYEPVTEVLFFEGDAARAVRQLF